MAASFDPTLSTDRDKVRSRLGDTDPADALLTDEEIDAYLTIEGTLRLATIACCKAILAKLARVVDMVTPAVEVSLSQRRDGYMVLLTELRAGAAMVPMFAGGTNLNDKALRNADTARTQPSFTRDGFDYPRRDSWPWTGSG
jgi:hypothetical protein